MMTRREFTGAASLLAASAAMRATSPSRRPRILLRSSWQTENIGDIAHTPGVLRLLEEHLPDARVQLWAMNTGEGVKEMLEARFPNVPILQDTASVKRAFEECDFLLHGSGPSLVARKNVAQWRTETGKPYGVFGITLPSVGDEVRELLTGAQFVFFRDSVSLQLARENGVECPIMEFGPDGAFAVDVRNDTAAESFLAAHGLERNRFLCCIPRYRYTPYWLIKDRPFDEQKHQRNEEMKEHDTAPLREAITAVVRQTVLKVLICPEDKTQMALGKEMLFDKLPEDVRARVVWRESYWLTDEAVSTYARSAGLFGLEMHSPIMCIGNGVPAIVCRFDEQTSKGFMWRDIGLDSWLFDMDSPEQVAQIVQAVLEMAKNPEAARAKAETARGVVREHQQRMVARLADALRRGA